jgi:hypothetical protein
MMHHRGKDIISIRFEAGVEKIPEVVYNMKITIKE